MTVPPNIRSTNPGQSAFKALLPWLPIVIGLAVLYVPSLYDLFTGIWSRDEQMHGPIVLGISLWLLHRNWTAMEQASLGQQPSKWGWPIFVFGLLLYVIGRSQDILIPEMGSLIWLITGILLLQRGTAALKVQWFAMFFMLFMVPLPGAVVDTVTMPMKMAVSYVSEQVLYFAGYVGLVSGACFADVGNDVLCLDVDPAKIKILEEGGIPIFEPGLQDMVKRNVAAGRLHFTTDAERAAHFGTIQFIAVGTPPDEDGSADMQYVIAAARGIGRYMTDYKVVVDKSTVPVGTADRVRAAITEELAKRGVDTPFSVVSNPEFLKEGAAIDDFMRPDRIVVGCDDEQAALNMRALYAPIQRNHDRLIVMDIRSAELTKYAANAMLATRISFMNELANLAEVLGADIENVRKGIGSDPRIGRDFLYAGAGYGGSCFPKDVQALIKTAQSDAGITLKVLNAVEAANDAQKRVLGAKVIKRFGSNLNGKHFAMWGLAFKANTDDMRKASSREVIADLLAAGATVTAYDPVAMKEARHIYANEPRLTFADSQSAVLEGADALIILTEWREFRSPNFDTIKTALKSPVIFDGRNLYDPKLVRDMGFEYLAIGR